MKPVEILVYGVFAIILILAFIFATMEPRP